MHYITPGRFRALGLGVDLSSTTDGTLWAHSATATALVNSFTAAPDGHDFRGASVTNESHSWDVGNVYRPGSHRVYPFHRPVKSASRIQIQVTDTQTITMSGTALYVHLVEGYVEPISLAVTTAGVFGLSIIPNIGLRVPVAKVDYEYGYEFTATDEMLVTTSGTTLRAQNQFWLTDEDVVIKKNGVAEAEGNYTLDRTEGTVVMDAYDSSASYTATYVYPLPTAIQRATAIIMADLIGYGNINASGLSGLSGIRVEEIELRQSSKAGFISVPLSPAAQALLAPYRYIGIR